MGGVSTGKLVIYRFCNTKTLLHLHIYSNFWSCFETWVVCTKIDPTCNTDAFFVFFFPFFYLFYFVLFLFSFHCFYFIFFYFFCFFIFIHLFFFLLKNQWQKQNIKMISKIDQILSNRKKRCHILCYTNSALSWFKSK
jgi:hypothetical protein